MDTYETLSDARRRRIVELLAEGERSSGSITAVIRAEFGISQPAVSQHLRALRDSGLATVRAEGTRRIYRLERAPLDEMDAWLHRVGRLWEHRLDALGTELARGRRAARRDEASRESERASDHQAKGA